MIDERFYEDLDLRVRRPAPQTVSILLRDLNLLDAPRDEQGERVRGWLRQHKASPSLRRSIDRSGLLDLPAAASCEVAATEATSPRRLTQTRHER